MEGTFKSICDNLAEQRQKQQLSPLLTPNTPSRQKKDKTHKSTPKRKRQNSGRNRTPSGLIIAPKVGTITAYLEKAKKVKIHKTSSHDKSLDESYEDICSQVEHNNSQGLEALMSEENVHGPMNTDINKDASGQVNNNCEEQMESVNMITEINQNATSDVASPAKAINANNILQRVEDHINKLKKGVKPNSKMEDSADPNPPTMSVTMVIKMFQELKKDINLQIESLSEKITKTNINSEDIQKINELEKAIEFQDSTVTSMQKDIKICQAKEKVLASTAGRQQCIIEELQNRIDRLELSQSKHMMMITGFYCDAKKQTYKRQLECFMEEEMGVSIVLEDVFKIGAHQPEAIVMTLPTIMEKNMIYQNVYKIKDIVNKDKRKIYFKDYTPTATMEKRKREQDIMNEMNDRPPMQQKEVKYTKKGLTIDGEAYTKKVQVPDPTKIIQMPISEIEKIMSIKMNNSEKISKENSEFLAFTAAVSSLKEISEGYMKIKLEHPGARHIVAVWCISGTKRHEVEDFQDDGEVGVGRICLQVMKENNITNRAFYIVRYYGGIKMGNDRFDCYIRVMKDALANSPTNRYTKTKQVIKEANQDADARFFFRKMYPSA